MRVLLLSKYGRRGASSRYRSYQYIPYLEEKGVAVTVAPFFDDDYLDRLYGGGRNPLTRIAAYYFRRLARVLREDSYDLVWMEKELLPWLPFLLEGPLLSRLKPLVVDYDDAIFHRYDMHRFAAVRILLGRKIDMVMEAADMVIAGNDYLAGRAREAGAPRVEVVPTVIDLRRYPQTAPETGEAFTIGWIGSPTSTRHLMTIGKALREFCSDGKSRLRIVGGAELPLNNVPMEILPWSDQGEFDLMKSFDIGIMPLPDSPWERGKCGFKLMQYMACGLPVIASPVGVNKRLVEDGVNGFLASNDGEWVRALGRLRDNAALRTSMGEVGRRKVEESFCLQVTAPRIYSLLSEVVYGNRRIKGGGEPA
ncbi:MAG: glycosyltransferase family 4 protein [Geobacteraceae bacterium]